MPWIPILVVVLLLVSIVAAFEAGLIYGVNRAVENMSGDIREVSEEEIIDAFGRDDDDKDDLPN